MLDLRKKIASDLIKVNNVLGVVLALVYIALITWGEMPTTGWAALVFQVAIGFSLAVDAKTSTNESKFWTGALWIISGLYAGTAIITLLGLINP